MGITNAVAGTRIDEIADSIYRISTPVPPTAIPGGFTFNQFLLTRSAVTLMEKLAGCEPATLACMHGSSWRGDGAKLLRELATSLDA